MKTKEKEEDTVSIRSIPPRGKPRDSFSKGRHSRRALPRMPLEKRLRHNLSQMLPSAFGKECLGTRKRGEVPSRRSYLCKKLPRFTMRKMSRNNLNRNASRVPREASMPAKPPLRATSLASLSLSFSFDANKRDLHDKYARRVASPKTLRRTRWSARSKPPDNDGRSDTASCRSWPPSPLPPLRQATAWRSLPITIDSVYRSSFSSPLPCDPHTSASRRLRKRLLIFDRTALSRPDKI